MAQTAFARPCKACGTLTTFSGNYSDETFATKCPCCGSTQTAPNPSGYVAPTPAPPVDPDPEPVVEAEADPVVYGDAIEAQSEVAPDPVAPTETDLTEQN